jgi:hypothetical protein
MSDLDDLARAALSKVDASSPLSDMERAASVAKVAADTNKINLEQQTAQRQMRLEWFKTASSLLVPIVSILTLFATIIVQSLQLMNLREENSSKEWRAFLDHARGSTTTQLISDPTFSITLKSFLKSKKYMDDGKELSKRIIGNVVDVRTFIDLFDIVFPDREKANISDLLEINKLISANIARTANLCDTLSKDIKLPPNAGYAKICDYAAVPDSDVIKHISFDEATSRKIFQVRSDFQALVNELIFISPLIGSRVRNFRAESANDYLNLKDSYIYSADLSSVNFRNINLDRAVFEFVNFRNAVLHPLGGMPFALSAGSNWWDANIIDPKLLIRLIEYYYPGHVSGYVVGEQPLTLGYYAKRVTELCKRVEIVCDVSALKYNSENVWGVAMPQR